MGWVEEFTNADHYLPLDAKIILALPFEDGDVILDIGANLGWYSLVMDKHINKTVRIYAFEPEAQNFSNLEANINLNNSSRVIPVNKAIAENTGSATLFLYDIKNTGRHSLLDINNSPDNAASVHTISLDEFLLANSVDFRSRKFLKVDIEGYEYIALRGTKELLVHVPFKLLEYTPERIRKGGDSPHDLINWLLRMDYVVHSIDTGVPIPLSNEELFQDNGTKDLFLCKRDHVRL